MTLTDAPRYAPTWLELREPADAEARATDLLGPLRRHLASRPSGATYLIRDLGCGTGSMQRWLAPLLPGPQRWILQDHDADLLAFATAHAATTAADGSPVTVMTRHADLTELTAGDLMSTSLVTASALLDLLSPSEVERLAAACVEAGCPALFTLSVTGGVDFTPADPLDAELSAGFADHLRDHVDGRYLLGADAANATADAFTRRGASVESRSSVWRLGSDRAALTAEWLRGWVPAAAAQRPVPDAEGYLTRRLDALAAGDLRVTVHHSDLLALPPGAARADEAAS
ncbi:methyltransferase domain-containing protein [Cryptosporangium aurantiacum]|uniref:methyltransferase domain-containing protein n=1 Tax=Cryptosporangium aurantiacum TaxID=134849 RepID=UPI001C4A4931|nr:methyltransferase domain-containing protein [Cryptosporangium aurantiacum]